MKNKTWQEEFENQSIIKVLKEAEDFNLYQYKLLIDLFINFISQKLKEERQRVVLKGERNRIIQQIRDEYLDINFYDWNEETQEMIKDKIRKTFKKLI